MRRRTNEDNAIIKRKWLSIVGFIISIILLSLAITLSMNEEKIAREAKLDSEAKNLKNSSNTSTIQKASSDLNKNVNEVKGQNTTALSNNIISSNSNIVSSTNTIDSNAVGQNVIESNSNGIEDGNTDTSTNASNSNNGDNETKNGNNNNAQFIMPIDGEHLTGFSMDSLVYSNTLAEWVTHRGIDIKAEKTSIVKASAKGEIKAIKDDPRYGLSIVIEHENGFQTIYSSLLSTEFVKEGDSVEQGQAIGTVGNSAVFETAEGSHLHFEILKDGEYINPDIYVK